MIIVEQAHEATQLTDEARRTGHTVGFVPTMGNLHDGHLALIRRLQQPGPDHCDFIAVSIFVNPLQFGPGEDYERYPRTFEADREKLAALGVDMVFHPTVEQIYPHWPPRMRVLADPDLSADLEGRQRPGHFDGVVTVVARLFNIIQPDIAVFGQKDYQQLRLIETLTEEQRYPIRIIRAPIVRESDGLAMSSRNRYLTPEQRHIAPALYATLRQTRHAILSGTPAETACTEAEQHLLKAGFDRVDYFTLRHTDTLKPWHPRDGFEKGILLAVARLGETRLLDNLLLTAD